MNVQSTSTCAIYEIARLSAHSTALEAMQDFCSYILGKPLKWVTAVPPNLACFYMFSGAVSKDGTSGAYVDTGRHADLYAKEFMQLIIDEDLGSVWESPVVRNMAHHPDHSNQVYIWTPDSAKLAAWWAKQTPAPKIPKLIGDWRIERMDRDGYICYGYDANSRAMGCERPLVRGTVVKWQYSGGRPTGNVLCAACSGGFTEEEIKVAMEAPLPPAPKEGWFDEAHKERGWICSGGFYKGKGVSGCRAHLVEGATVRRRYFAGHGTGSVFCKACSEQLDEKDWLDSLGPEDEYEPEWDDYGGDDPDSKWEDEDCEEPDGTSND